MPACPNCGEDNPAAARFCFGCGTSLVAAPAVEERKVVGVLDFYRRVRATAHIREGEALLAKTA